MKRTALALLTLVVSAHPGFSQDKPFMDDLYYYLENTAVFEAGQEDGRAYYIPQTSLSLNGRPSTGPILHRHRDTYGQQGGNP